MDKGVRGDYLQRNFKALEDDQAYRRKVMTREERNRFYSSKASHYQKRDADNLAALESVQQSRPLKPGGIK